jgi:hypothetical protein
MKQGGKPRGGAENLGAGVARETWRNKGNGWEEHWKCTSAGQDVLLLQL